MGGAHSPSVLVPALALAVGLVVGWLVRPALLPPPPPPDPDAAVAGLIQADKDFAQMSRERGMAEAFEHFLAEDARSLPAAADPVLGRERIRQLLATGPKTTLTWEPQGGSVARSGDYGTTWGTFESTVPAETGPAHVTHGKYVNVWRKGPDGRWRVVLDIGNSPPPKAPPKGIER